MAQNGNPNQNRDRIIGWLNEDGIQNQLVQLNEQQVGQFGFLIQTNHPPVPSIAIYSSIRHPDRIFIQSEIGLTPPHVELVNTTWEEGRRNEFFLELQHRAILYNVRHRLLFTENQFSGFRINLHIVEHALTKDRFLNNYLRIEEVLNALLNFANMNLGIGMQQPPPDEAPDFIR